MPMSKIYGVKSNAARAAAAYKLTRADLVPVSGGWCFPIPDETPSDGAIYAAVSNKLADAAGVPPLPPAPAGWDSVEGGAKTVEEWEAAGNPWRHGCDPEKAAAIVEAADPNEPDVPDARAAHTVVNGRPTSDPLPPGPWGDDQPAPSSVSTTFTRSLDKLRKPPRQRREKAADKPKTAKRTKAPRPVVDGATKRGTKAYADKMAARRRAGMNKRGITELVIKEIRTRWTPTSALLKMTGWQPTTLRGVLSLYAKKEGIEIKGETRDGERYYLVAR